MAVAASGSNLLPDTFVELWIELRELKTAMEEATSRFRTHRKRMEKAGVDLKSLALVEQFAKLDDDVASARLRSMLQLAGWLKLPIGTQGSLFPEPSQTDAPGQKMELALTEQEVSEQGYAAGKRGDNRDENPHDNGTALFAAWDRGWIRGQKVIAEAMARGDAPKKAKPRRVAASRRGSESRAALGV